MQNLGGRDRLALMVILAGGVMLLAPPAVPPREVLVASTLPEQILQGQDLYSINCVECHGADGEGGIIQGVEGLEGFNMKAIHSQDEMYTRTDADPGGHHLLRAAEPGHAAFW